MELPSIRLFLSVSDQFEVPINELQAVILPEPFIPVTQPQTVEISQSEASLPISQPQVVEIGQSEGTSFIADQSANEVDAPAPVDFPTFAPPPPRPVSSPGKELHITHLIIPPRTLLNRFLLV